MRHGSVEWLTASFGQSTQANAWAGPDHWKYHKPRGKCCKNPFLVFPACYRTSMDDCRVYANCNSLVLISVVCQVLPFVLIQVPRFLISSSPVLHNDPLSQVSFAHHSFTTCFWGGQIINIVWRLWKWDALQAQRKRGKSGNILCLILRIHWNLICLNLSPQRILTQPCWCIVEGFVAHFSHQTCIMRLSILWPFSLSLLSRFLSLPLSHAQISISLCQNC